MDTQTITPQNNIANEVNPKNIESTQKEVTAKDLLTNRTKKAHFILRLHARDREMLEKQSKKHNISKSRLIRMYIHNKKTEKIIKQLNEHKAMQMRILLEISRVAGNINQIAYHLHTDSIPKQEALTLFLQQADYAKKIFHFFQKEAQKRKQEIEQALQ